MKLRYCWVLGILVAIGLGGLNMLGCATLKSKPQATFQVIPEKIVLSPKLIKEPVAFKGSGFAPKEMVIVEMLVPPTVKIMGAAEGEDVGLAFGKADDKGDFETKMAPTATLNSFLQVGWADNLAIIFEQAKPIPPGKYELRATGVDSGLTGKSILEILPPPKKN